MIVAVAVADLLTLSQGGGILKLLFSCTAVTTKFLAILFIFTASERIPKIYEQCGRVLRFFFVLDFYFRTLCNQVELGNFALNGPDKPAFRIDESNQPQLTDRMA